MSTSNAIALDPQHSPPWRSRSVQSPRALGYQVDLLDGTVEDCAAALGRILGGRRALIVTTPTVGELYGRTLLQGARAQGSKVDVETVACSEAIKGVGLVERICAAARRAHIDREGVLVALGGGVCSDVVTVASAWLRRGISHINVPTTLVGQIDAGIGVKGAVNFQGAKSYLGCFHPPEHVLVAPTFLASLPTHSMVDGLAEILKIALVRDPALLALLEAHGCALRDAAFQEPVAPAFEVIWRAIARMLEELEPNLFEDQGYERLVDFGHTVSPLLESASAHQLSHGRAVAVDMAFSAALSARCGWLDVAGRDRILKLLVGLGLPVWVSELTVPRCREALVQSAMHRGGRTNLVLPTRNLGVTFLSDGGSLSDEDLGDAIRVVRAWQQRRP